MGSPTCELSTRLGPPPRSILQSSPCFAEAQRSDTSCPRPQTPDLRVGLSSDHTMLPNWGTNS